MLWCCSLPHMLTQEMSATTSGNNRRGRCCAFPPRALLWMHSFVHSCPATPVWDRAPVAKGETARGTAVTWQQVYESACFDARHGAPTIHDSTVWFVDLREAVGAVLVRGRISSGGVCVNGTILVLGKTYYCLFHRKFLVVDLFVNLQVQFSRSCNILSPVVLPFNQKAHLWTRRQGGH